MATAVRRRGHALSDMSDANEKRNATNRKRFARGLCAYPTNIPKIAFLLCPVLLLFWASSCTQFIETEDDSAAGFSDFREEKVGAPEPAGDETICHRLSRLGIDGNHMRWIALLLVIVWLCCPFCSLTTDVDPDRQCLLGSKPRWVVEEEEEMREMTTDVGSSASNKV